MRNQKLRKNLIYLWFDYENAGTPYGNSFSGFMQWLKEKESYENMPQY